MGLFCFFFLWPVFSAGEQSCVSNMTKCAWSHVIDCVYCHSSGPLRSIMKDLHSDDNEEESDEAEDNDNDSEMERPVNRGGSRSRRWVTSQGCSSLRWKPARSLAFPVEPQQRCETPNPAPAVTGHIRVRWVPLACLYSPLQGTLYPFSQGAEVFPLNILWGKRPIRSPCSWKRTSR